MPEVPALPDPDFDAVFADLDRLTRASLVRYRIEVGRVLVTAFFGGDLANYRAHDPTKATPWGRFAEQYREPLADLGLSERLMRQSVLAFGVVQHLPAEAVERLLFSHFVALARLEDPATCRALADMAADEGWSVTQTRDAVARVRAGQWVDADAEAPGLQPAPPDVEVDERPPALGRVVNQVERVLGELGAATERWGRAPRERMTPLQADRVRAAVAEMRARLAELEAGLGET